MLLIDLPNDGPARARLRYFIGPQGTRASRPKDHQDGTSMAPEINRMKGKAMADHSVRGYLPHEEYAVPCTYQDPANLTSLRPPFPEERIGRMP